MTFRIERITRRDGGTGPVPPIVRRSPREERSPDERRRPPERRVPPRAPRQEPPGDGHVDVRA